MGLCLLLALLLIAAALAQASQPGAPSPMGFEMYDVYRGLPENTVNDLLEDRYGFIWIAT